jgi:hypothetical protein
MMEAILSVIHTLSICKHGKAGVGNRHLHDTPGLLVQDIPIHLARLLFLCVPTLAVRTPIDKQDNKSTKLGGLSETAVITKHSFSSSDAVI